MGISIGAPYVELYKERKVLLALVLGAEWRGRWGWTEWWEDDESREIRGAMGREKRRSVANGEKREGKAGKNVLTRSWATWPPAVVPEAARV